MARYLIDSHIFLWSIDAPERLLAPEQALLSDQTADVAVSVVSFWELSIKFAKGQLPLAMGTQRPSDDHFRRHAAIAGFSILPIEAPETEYVRRLPYLHRDPFDRLLIAQAMIGGRIIVTRDKIFADYPGVQVLSAE